MYSVHVAVGNLVMPPLGAGSALKDQILYPNPERLNLAMCMRAISFYNTSFTWGAILTNKADPLSFRKRTLMGHKKIQTKISVVIFSSSWDKAAVGFFSHPDVTSRTALLHSFSPVGILSWTKVLY